MRLVPSRCLCGAVAVQVIGSKDARPVGRCVRCALVRTCSVPDDYMTLYTTGDRYHSGRAGHVPYRDRFAHDQCIAALRWPRLLSHLRLLDVGCANGAFVRHAADQGVAAEGLEPNAGMAAWAQERCGRPIHRSWDTVRGKFDVITYHDVIEHVPDPWHELRRLRRFLRASGLLVIDTPDVDDSRFDRLGLAWHHMKPQEHLWFFSERHLRGLVERAGFEVDQVDRPIEGKIVLYARLRRARLPRSG
jgi:2-polyprenyl-3-methyl-5-hydroxy-6-metoxy-1,4-benzoquinol methylase